jgi:hypothetical protein
MSIRLVGFIRMLILGQTSSASRKDTTKVRWHGDENLTMVPKWYASIYLHTLLGCSKDIF